MFPLWVLSRASSTKFDKIEGVIVLKSLALAENWLNVQEKASFLLILTKFVQPISQSGGPILRHTTLEGTLMEGVAKHNTVIQQRPNSPF